MPPKQTEPLREHPHPARPFPLTSATGGRLRKRLGEGSALSPPVILFASRPTKELLGAKSSFKSRMLFLFSSSSSPSHKRASLFPHDSPPRSFIADRPDVLSFATDLPRRESPSFLSAGIYVISRRSRPLLSERRSRSAPLDAALFGKSGRLCHRRPEAEGNRVEKRAPRRSCNRRAQDVNR